MCYLQEPSGLISVLNPAVQLPNSGAGGFHLELSDQFQPTLEARGFIRDAGGQPPHLEAAGEARSRGPCVGAVGWGKGEQPRRLSQRCGKCFLSLCAGLHKIPWVMLPMQLCWGFTCSTEALVLSPLELFCRTLIFIPPCP